MWGEIGKFISDYYKKNDSENEEQENDYTNDIIKGASGMLAPDPMNPVGSAMKGTGSLIKGIAGAIGSK